MKYSSSSNSGPMKITIGADAKILSGNKEADRLFQLLQLSKNDRNFYQLLDQSGSFSFAGFLRSSKVNDSMEALLHLQNHQEVLWKITRLPGHKKQRTFSCEGFLVFTFPQREALSALVQQYAHPNKAEIQGTIFLDQRGHIICATQNAAFLTDVSLHQLNGPAYRPLFTDQHKVYETAGGKTFSISKSRLNHLQQGEVYQTDLTVSATGRKIQLSLQLADPGNDYGCRFIVSLLNMPHQGETGKLVVMEPPKQDFNDLYETLQAYNNLTIDAIWELDMASGDLVYNEKCTELLGSPSEKMNNITWWLRHIHRSDRRRMLNIIKTVLQSRAVSWSESYRLKKADGNFIQVTDHGTVIYKKGVAVKMIGCFRDVSVLTDLQNELQRERIVSQRKIAETIIQISEMERSRFGREMHDNINQILTSANLYLGLLKVEGEEQISKKERGLELILMAIREIRKLSQTLVTAGVEASDLVSDINLLIEDFRNTTELNIQFEHSLEGCNISEEKKITVYRIIQEQMKNIIKHSRANSAKVQLAAVKNDIMLSVADDGIGMNAKGKSSGIGLTNIQSRVQVFNGFLTIDTAPGKGFALKIILPNKESNSKETTAFN